MTELTNKQKAEIDAMSYEELLSHWRFAPAGNPWFQGETGKYWQKRMSELQGPNSAAVSKKIGWEQP